MSLMCCALSRIGRYVCTKPEGHPGNHYNQEHDITFEGDEIEKTVDHPAHYGGADNPYEAIKVIDAWKLEFCLGNAVKYICRAGKKTFVAIAGTDTSRQEAIARSAMLEDLKKARWYLDHEISKLENRK